MLVREDAEAINHLLGLIEDRQNVILDFSDERQYRAALAIHSLGGHTPETRPGMHAALAERRERHLAQGGLGDEQLPTDAQFQTGAQVNELSRVAGTQNAGSTGFAGIVGGAFQLNSTIAVFGPLGTVALASGSGSMFNQGDYLGLRADPVAGHTAQAHMTGAILYSYQQQAGDPWITGSTKLDVALGVVTPNPVVTHPNKHQDKIPSNYIRIALAEGRNSPDDVDYWYWYKENTTNYALPWVGHVTFNAEPEPLRYDVNPQIVATLAHGPGGSGGFAQLGDDATRKLFDSLQVSGTTLSWTMVPPADRPPWGAVGDPLLWGSLNWQTGEAEYLTIQLTVNLQGQTIPATATVQSSDIVDQDQLDGTTYIPRIQFLYSCLVAGTPILLADGSSIPIEDVVRGTVVRCGDGAARTVSSTTIFRFGGDVLRLRTGNGLEVALSGNHPVVTADGLMQAHELSPGVKLHAQGGSTAELTEAVREPYQGLLCNLRLDESQAPDPAKSTVFAGGIEVGDYALQMSYDRSRRTDPARVTALLEPRYLPDYEHYLRETATNR
jgi:hypothetical protein